MLKDSLPAAASIGSEASNIISLKRTVLIKAFDKPQALWGVNRAHPLIGSGADATDVLAQLREGLHPKIIRADQGREFISIAIGSNSANYHRQFLVHVLS